MGDVWRGVTTHMLDYGFLLLLCECICPDGTLSRTGSSPRASSGFVDESSAIEFFFSSPRVLEAAYPLFVVVDLLP